MKSMKYEFCLSVLCSSLIAIGLPATAADSSTLNLKKLPPVQVTGQKKKPINTGKAAQGYRVTNANLGPLGSKKVLDLPYAVQSTSSEFITRGCTDCIDR